MGFYNVLVTNWLQSGYPQTLVPVNTGDVWFNYIEELELRCSILVTE